MYCLAQYQTRSMGFSSQWNLGINIALWPWVKMSSSIFVFWNLQVSHVFNYFDYVFFFKSVLFIPHSSSKDFDPFWIPEEVTNFCGLPSHIVSLKNGCFPHLKCSFCVQSMHHWHMHNDQNSDQIKKLLCYLLDI